MSGVPTPAPPGVGPVLNQSETTQPSFRIPLPVLAELSLGISDFASVSSALCLGSPLLSAFGL